MIFEDFIILVIDKYINNEYYIKEIFRRGERIDMKDMRQVVELFHLVFLDILGRKIDRRFYALKGGCNLRFYLKSFRYSEDMDIDIQGMPREKLEDVVSGILASTPFSQILKARGISLVTWSAPKQTETTQRWKLSIVSDGISIPMNTKIEFSRRGIREDVAFEALDPLLLGEYSLPPIMTNHYTRHSAYVQKIEALVSRKITQARDIFDLNLLIGSGVDTSICDSKLKLRLDEAISNAMSVKFDTFKSQVISYLPLEYQPAYDSESSWDDMVLRIAEALGREKE